MAFRSPSAEEPDGSSSGVRRPEFERQGLIPRSLHS